MLTRTHFAKFLLLFLFISILIVDSTFAHPPQDIQLSYDKEKKVLDIIVKHTTKDLFEHYIKKLIIYKNDEELSQHSFKRQTTAARLVATVPLEVESEDVIRVEAICSEVGRKQKVLIIP